MRGRVADTARRRKNGDSATARSRARSWRAQRIRLRLARRTHGVAFRCWWIDRLDKRGSGLRADRERLATKRAPRSSTRRRPARKTELPSSSNARRHPGDARNSLDQRTRIARPDPGGIALADLRNHLLMEIVHLGGRRVGKFLFVRQAALVDVLLQQRVDVVLLFALRHFVFVVEHQFVDQKFGEAERLLVDLLLLGRNRTEIGPRRFAQRRRGRRDGGRGQRRRRFSSGRSRQHWSRSLYRNRCRR